MSTGNEPVLKDPVFGDLTLNWKWMLGLGLFMAILGLIGLGMTYWLTILSVIWFGVLAAIAGIAQLIDAFRCRGWKAVASHVLLGLLYLAAGVVLIGMPVQSAWWLTLLIGAMLIVTGVLRIFMAFQVRGGGAAPLWLGISGAISILLGVLIYSIVDLPTEETIATAEAAQGWFKEWGWVIGMFVAIEFVVHGAALTALALAARSGSANAPKGPDATSGTGAAAA